MDAPEALIIDLLDYLRAGAMPYRDVMNAWRTSCPRLPVWEDAIEFGLIQRSGDLVTLTDAGIAYLTSRN